MTPCEELEQDLELALTVKEKETPSFGRLLLRVIGLEELYDIITGEKKINWKIIIDLVILGDLAVALARLAQMLGELGLTGTAKKLIAQIGPWAIAIWLVILGIELVIWIRERNRAQDHFDEEVRRLYQSTDCRERDDVLRKKAIPIPGTL